MAICTRRHTGFRRLTIAREGFVLRLVERRDRLRRHRAAYIRRGIDRHGDPDTDIGTGECNARLGDRVRGLASPLIALIA
jgi:hypothetical protein